MLIFSVPVFAKVTCEDEASSAPAQHTSLTLLRKGDLIIMFNGEVRWQGKTVTLSKKHSRARILLRVLFALAAASGELVETQNVFEEGWLGEDTLSGPAASVSGAIVHLRRAFSEVDPGFKQIETLNGGYSWIRTPSTETLIGDAAIDSSNRKFYWRDHEIEFNNGEFNIVEKLLSSPGHIFSQIEIFEAYSSMKYNENRDDDATNNSIKFRVARIRAKILEVDAGFKSLKNVYGQGYAWDAGESLNEKIEVGNLTLFPGLHEVKWNNKSIRLKPGQFRILKELATHPGRETSLSKLWAEFSDSLLVQKDLDLIYMRIAHEISTMRKLFRVLDPTFACLKKSPNSGYYWQE